MKNRKHKLTPIFLIALILGGCSLAPTYQRSEPELAAKFEGANVSTASVADLKWDQVFKDPILQSLIKMSLEENKDIKIAIARINEARARVGFTEADQFPTLDLEGQASRLDPSNRISDSISSPFNRFSLLGRAGFELDLWGKLRNATEAERADLLASEYAMKSVQITLISEVAALYFRILGTEERIAVTKATISNRAEATRIMKAKLDKGVIPELELNQAEIEEQNARLTEVALERDLAQAENSLRVLLGRATFPIPRNGSITHIANYTEIPLGVPATLLERRPDIMQAEETAKAEVARIGVAEADRWPSLGLFGDIGFQSEKTSDFASRDAFTWGFGAGLLGPIIDFGKRKAAVGIAEARAEQAYKNYEQTVLRSVQEVQDSLVGIKTYLREIEHNAKKVKSAKNASGLSRARYDEGVTSYLEVLEVERSLFDAQLGESNSREAYLATSANLYKALGGGW